MPLRRISAGRTRVRERGLEPLSLSAADPKSAAYTSSATPAGKNKRAVRQYSRTEYRDRHPTHTNSELKFNNALSVPRSPFRVISGRAADGRPGIRVGGI